MHRKYFTVADHKCVEYMSQLMSKISGAIDYAVDTGDPQADIDVKQLIGTLKKMVWLIDHIGECDEEEIE